MYNFILNSQEVARENGCLLEVFLVVFGLWWCPVGSWGGPWRCPTVDPKESVGVDLWKINLSEYRFNCVTAQRTARTEQYNSIDNRGGRPKGRGSDAVVDG